MDLFLSCFLMVMHQLIFFNNIEFIKLTMILIFIRIENVNKTQL